MVNAFARGLDTGIYDVARSASTADLASAGR